METKVDKPYPRFKPFINDGSKLLKCYGVKNDIGVIAGNAGIYLTRELKGFESAKNFTFVEATQACEKINKKLDHWESMGAEVDDHNVQEFVRCKI
jgi:hypothetical protein